MDSQNNSSLDKLTPAKEKLSAANQLNFKQSKPVLSYDTKAASSLAELHLVPGKNCEIVASSPSTTSQNAQNHFQYQLNPQYANQRGSINKYLVNPHGNMMNTALPNAMNFSANSMC